MLLVLSLALAGCGMSKAVRQTGETFDKYGCLAKEFKGEEPCEATDQQ